MSEWINVNDRLPTKSGKYIVIAIEDKTLYHITFANFGKVGFYMTGHCAYWRITHWMPMPEIPEEIKRGLRE